MTQDRVALDLRKAGARLGELADEMARGASRPELLAELAITLGLYRLYGGAPSACKRLTPEQGLGAVPVLRRWVAQSLASARGLEAVWDQCDDIEEALSASHALLSDRFHCHAALTALTRDAGPSAELSEAVRQFEQDVTSLDDEMEARRELFHEAALAGTTAAWREALADEYRAELPWWLSPELEEEARMGREWADETAERVLRPPFTWGHPDGACRATMSREAGGCVLTFQPPEGLEGRAVWLGGHMGAIQGGRAVVKVPEWEIVPGLELAVGQPGRKWERIG